MEEIRQLVNRLFYLFDFCGNFGQFDQGFASYGNFTATLHRYKCVNSGETSNEMIRVLRIINRFNLGGPTYNAAYLTRYMPEDYETLLVGGLRENDEESSEFILKEMGVEPVIIPEMRRSINPRNDLIAYRKLKRIIRDYQPHIVHTHASKAGMLGRRAAFSLGVPVVVHTFHGHVFHSYFNSLTTNTFITIERNLAKKTSRIIAISEKQKEELSTDFRIAPRNKIDVIPLGFDLSRFRTGEEEKRRLFRSHYNLDSDEIAIGIVGRLAPVKNHSLFVESIKWLKSHTNRKVRGFIIGDGNIRSELEQLSHNLDLTITPNSYTGTKADITFTSWLKDVDVAYAGLDIIALTSLNEGTPVSLIEAQAAGRAVVSTRVGGIENVVMEGSTALLSTVGKSQDFFNNLQTIVENDSRRTELGKRGWSYVSAKYDYKRLIHDMDDLYKELLKSADVREMAKVV